MARSNLYALLQGAATRHPQKGLIFYDTRDEAVEYHRIGYRDLLALAQSNAGLLKYHLSVPSGAVVLLHFDTHHENVVWFWSVIVFGGIPAISSPFSSDLLHRKAHLEHLQALLGNPVCLTSERLAGSFTVTGLAFDKLYTIEALHDMKTCYMQDQTSEPHTFEPTACLLLTSGSTGSAKAVKLEHKQIMCSLAGKSQHHGTVSNDSFFNWIGLDHVANLTEIHLHATYLGADQIHAQTEHIVSDPLLFLDLLSRHSVAYTFAPNSFLAALQKSLQAAGRKSLDYDLSKLRCLISGGEANDVETIRSLTTSLQAYNGNDAFIRPGFGMTETCAGSIYSRCGPGSGADCEREFSDLGTCIPGLRMRVVSTDGNRNLPPGEIGDLEFTGPIVFSGYYNNQRATSEAFTCDGWFRTGDRAFIDTEDRLHLTGRSKETINIHGVKFFPHEIESAIEHECLSGVSHSFTVAFAHRREGDKTEGVCVFYLPTFKSDDVATLAATNHEISRIIALITNSRPILVLPLSSDHFQKSSLGKLSRAKLQKAHANGQFSSLIACTERRLDQYAFENHQEPHGFTETIVAEQIVKVCNLPHCQLSSKRNILEIGLNSMELIRLKRRLQYVFGIKQLDLMALLKKPTVQAIASEIEKMTGPTLNGTTCATRKYDPVVTLSDQGASTPLWLIHPGVGEVLIFVPLGKCFVDRPLYALRARGFGPGETPFTSISEAVDTYHNAIKSHQPTGPYALAGYSYGSMLAFEVAKKFEAFGDEVRFLGILKLPPHIKIRMRQLDIIEVLLSLTFFLRLITEETARDMSPELHQCTPKQALDSILDMGSRRRLDEVDLSPSRFWAWARLAHDLQAMARDYEPGGKVRSVDVFCADPLAIVAASRQEWVESHLLKWRDFSGEEPRVHHVQGAYYTMLDAENLVSFQRKLKGALAQRGL